MEYQLSDKLKELRLNKGVTQKTVADYIEVDVTTYAHYEKGRRSPNADKLRRLAMYYGLIDEIFDINRKNDSKGLQEAEDRSVELTRYYIESLKKKLNVNEKEAVKLLDIPDDIRKRLLLYYEQIYKNII